MLHSSADRAHFDDDFPPSLRNAATWIASIIAVAILVILVISACACCGRTTRRKVKTEKANGTEKASDSATLVKSDGEAESSSVIIPGDSTTQMAPRIFRPVSKIEKKPTPVEKSAASTVPADPTPAKKSNSSPAKLTSPKKSAVTTDKLAKATELKLMPISKGESTTSIRRPKSLRKKRRKKKARHQSLMLTSGLSEENLASTTTLTGSSKTASASEVLTPSKKHASSQLRLSLIPSSSLVKEAAKGSQLV